ncbi:VanW family protein [Ammonicoccus fulvus]|uniref:VanW family protein n=1 Tax=Ammonicoccus fulvus TaxID=3138240 RepID=A0ABZ3FUG8_9ACTN
MSSDQPTVPNPVPPPDAHPQPEQLSEQPPTLQPEAERRPRRGGRVAVIAGVVVLVLLGAAYVAGYVMSGDRLPRNASVAGIELGGLSSSEAEQKLVADYGPRVTAPITVTLDEQPHEVLPAEAGLSVDYAATVQSSGVGKSWHPAHIWRVLTGGGPVDPVVLTDEAALNAAVTKLAEEVDRPAVDATVEFEDAEVKRTPAEQALAVDREQVDRELRRAFPDTDQVSGTVNKVDPAITDADVDEAIKSYATPALSGPIKVDTGEGVFDVTPAMIGNASTFVVEDGALKGRTDAGRLFENAKPALDKLNFKKAKNASYKMEGGGLVVVPSVDGAELKREDFEKVVMPALLTTERSVKAELTNSRAKFTTEEAEKQKPKEVIGEFTTYYPHAAYRNTNLGLAARRINGNTIAVGDVFSLDRALGPRTASSGYVDGWVVAGSRLKKENAGGISQSATTVFNAGWFAGLEDVEHQPHTMYFDRYPAGRESTIYSGHIDVKFRNTTDNAIYVQASQSNSSAGSRGSITVRIWGTKKWDIESPTPTKSGFYNGRTITDSGSSCNPQSASPGFTARYYRLFKVNGQVVKREDKTWKYNATDEIKCTG